MYTCMHACVQHAESTLATGYPQRILDTTAAKVQQPASQYCNEDVPIRGTYQFLVDKREAESRAAAAKIVDEVIMTGGAHSLLS